MARRFAPYVLAAFLVSCLLNLGFYHRELFSSPSPFQNFHTDFLDEGIPDEPRMSIPLHPEKHISREAGIIKLQWNITQGHRSPDGVRKLVYLINGSLPCLQEHWTCTDAL